MRSGNELTNDEKRIFDDQSSLCDCYIGLDDLVFSYPSTYGDLKFSYETLPEYNARAKYVAKRLQEIMNFLIAVTGKCPTDYFGSRVVVRWRKDHEQKGKENWNSCRRKGMPGHYVNLSWDYMLDVEKTKKDDEPITVCAHGLVHPFYAASELHTEEWPKNESWGEGFCDFMRGPILSKLGRNGVERWQRSIKKARTREEYSRYDAPASCFVMMFLEHCRLSEKYMDRAIKDIDALRSFVKGLFSDYSNQPLENTIRSVATQHRFAFKG